MRRLALLAGRAAVAVAGALALLGAGCDEVTTTVTTFPPTVVPASPTVVMVGSLAVQPVGQPSRSFIVQGGIWRVCDRVVVTNTTRVAVTDVRVTVVYLDRGQVVGQVTRSQSPSAGGEVGNLAPAESRSVTVCGLAHNEPDTDRLTATAA